MERSLRMKLEVNNFAKIKEANIKIDGITVIAGENNTGKSTIGKILYSLFTIFHELDEKKTNERVKSVFNCLVETYGRALLFNDLEHKFELSVKLVAYKTADIEDIKTVLQEANIDDLDEHKLYLLKKQIEFDDHELERLIIDEIFHMEFNNQITPMFGKEMISTIKATIKDKSIEITFEKNKSNLINKMDLYNDGIYIDNPFIIDSIRKSEPHKDITLFADYFMGNDYAHETVLKNKLSKSLQNSESLIEKAIYKQRIEKIIDTIKHTVSGDFKEREDRFTFLENNHTEIELANLSTGIKSFAILLKLLENNDINDHSLVTLDEPEVHLHPKWQIIYAELLVLLQKEFNLNIVLTTHSPYFVNALEVYSKKHSIEERCNYYLAKVEDDQAIMDDVSDNPEKIYKKLAEPFEILSREEDELNDIEL